jgi:hypothetical protein
VWFYKGVPGGVYFYADLLSSITEAGKTTVLNSATLWYLILNAYDPSPTYTVQAFRITEDWPESVQVPSSYSGPAYAEGYGTYTGVPQYSGWVTLDVTNLVKSWADGTYTNYGVMIKDTDGWCPQAIYSREVGDWGPSFNIKYSTIYTPTQNAAFNVPGVNSITLDGDLSDWPADSQWSLPFIHWNGAALGSTTRAKFTWNDANDTLYVAVQTDQANGGHVAIGIGKSLANVPSSGVGSTQLAFDVNPMIPNKVDIMNEITAYMNAGGWDEAGINEVDAKYSVNNGVYTYEIAIPFWTDWRVDQTAVRQTLWVGDTVYLYAIMESAFGTGDGTDMTFDGNPAFGNGAFSAGAALTLGPVPTPTPTPTPAPLAGDANNDKKVDVSDLGILAANYGMTSGATWDKGDFNNDGKVDVSDLGILAANYGTGTGTALDFNADAKAFGLAADAKEDTPVTSTLGCGSAGLPLVAGLLLAALTLGSLKIKE